MKKLSIVIPARNQQAPLGRAIQQFHVARGQGQVEVLVVDAGSCDGSVTVADLLADRVERMSVVEGNWEVAARNLGAARARGDVVLFLDPGARLRVAPETLFGRLSDAFGGERIVSCVTLPSCSRSMLEEDSAGVTNLATVPDTTSGWFLAVRRGLFLKEGGFKEIADQPAEDLLIERLAFHGAALTLEESLFWMPRDQELTQTADAVAM